MKKFKALVHYVIHECANPDQLGAIRLNKVLWFADVMAFQLDGKPITNEIYVKRQYGPAPKRVLHALNELQQDGCITVREPQYQFDSRKFISLKDPDLRGLTHRERNLASAVLNGVLGHTANSISEMTHDNVWRAALEGEEIPLQATFASVPGEITEEVVAWAKDALANA